MNYLQEHDDDLSRRLVSLAYFDTTTENGELVTLLKWKHFVNICQLFGKEQRQKSTLSLLVGKRGGI